MTTRSFILISSLNEYKFYYLIMIIKFRLLTSVIGNGTNRWLPQFFCSFSGPCCIGPYLGHGQFSPRRFFFVPNEMNMVHPFKNNRLRPSQIHLLYSHGVKYLLQFNCSSAVVTHSAVNFKSK